jgi:hypothetical protein
VYIYPKCKDGRVVADVVRLEKGHTEGLEPKVTEALVKLMVSAKGGRLRPLDNEAHLSRREVDGFDDPALSDLSQREGPASCLDTCGLVAHTRDVA